MIHILFPYRNPSRDACEDALSIDEETEAPCLVTCPKVIQLTERAHLSGLPVSPGSVTLLGVKNPIFEVLPPYRVCAVTWI